MHLLDSPDEYPNSDVSEVAGKIFKEHYLNLLGEDVRFVRLASEFRVSTVLGYHSYGLISVAEMHKKDRRCDELIEKTAAALDDDAVSLMLIGVQRDNLELSVRMALNR